jgi:hypothetical protein
MKVNIPVIAAGVVIQEAVKWLVERIKKAWSKRKK